MTEKMERLELDMESKDKVILVNSSGSYVCFNLWSDRVIMWSEQQLVELHDLYNSQLLLTADLSDKLEKTQVKIPPFVPLNCMLSAL